MLVLASGSPTRALLLEKAGIVFYQKGVDFDEEALRYSSPKSFCYYATQGKLHRFLELHGLKEPVLAADTVVTCKGRLLQKASTEEEARTMLALQSGSRVSILTCMMYKTSVFEFVDISTTHYDFAVFNQTHLEAYLQEGAWQGKAGAIMVEGFCKPYIRAVVGYESNAMGLCVEKLLPLLESS